MNRVCVKVRVRAQCKHCTHWAQQTLMRGRRARGPFWGDLAEQAQGRPA